MLAVTPDSGQNGTSGQLLKHMWWFRWFPLQQRSAQTQCDDCLKHMFVLPANTSMNIWRVGDYWSGQRNFCWRRLWGFLLESELNATVMLLFKQPNFWFSPSFAFSEKTHPFSASDWPLALTFFSDPNEANNMSQSQGHRERLFWCFWGDSGFGIMLLEKWWQR